MKTYINVNRAVKPSQWVTPLPESPSPSAGKQAPIGFAFFFPLQMSTTDQFVAAVEGAELIEAPAANSATDQNHRHKHHRRRCRPGSGDDCSVLDRIWTSFKGNTEKGTIICFSAASLGTAGDASLLL